MLSIVGIRIISVPNTTLERNTLERNLRIMKLLQHSSIASRDFLAGIINCGIGSDRKRFDMSNITLNLFFTLRMISIYLCSPTAAEYRCWLGTDPIPDLFISQYESEVPEKLFFYYR